MIKHEDIILYHGSKGGIDGKIAPSSRVRCDFGRGFYMGTDASQAKSLVSGDDMPYFYKLKFRLSEIPEERILYLDGKDWLYTVLACRRADNEYMELDIAKQALNNIRNYDLVIGSIADDKMREAMSAFIDNALTDEGLFHCLTFVNYGLQIVAKTEFACSKIEILEEKMLKGQELQNAIDYSSRKLAECRQVVNNAKRKFNDKGRTFYSIINDEKEKNEEYER